MNGAKHVAVTAATVVTLLVGTEVPVVHADNSRLNRSVVSNVYTMRYQHGCYANITPNPQLRLAAEWHTNDVMNNRGLNGDIGSDGSSTQDRARAAGYRGRVAETVAINPALAISGIELVNQWFHRPDYTGIFSDCGFSEIGVWSANSLDRTVVVAVHGAPE